MKNADQGSCRREFAESGERRCVACAIVLLMTVFGGTQLLLAQHSMDDWGSAGRQDESQDAQPGGGGSLASSDDRKHWSAEPRCFDQGSSIPDRSESRSWVLMSPDGRYKAYAVNEAFDERAATGEISACRSTTKLFVTGPESEEAKPVLVVEPTESASGNGIELVDWSHDGHRLVVIEFSLPWASDNFGIRPRVYDADSGKMSDENLFCETFRQLAGRYCDGVFDPIGFTPEGKAVVTVYPDLNEEQALEKNSCVKGVETWELDLAATKMKRLPDDYKVERYGKRFVLKEPSLLSSSQAR